MSRCIVVLSIGRSGSSAVSGMLHKLGVNMGAEFVPASYGNPYGTYEDKEFYDVTRQVFAGNLKPSAYAPIAQDRLKNAGQVWGVKDPALCQTFHLLLPYLGDDVRVIVVWRDKDAAIASLNKFGLMGINGSTKWYDELYDNLVNQIDQYTGQVLQLEWEDVLKEPKATAHQLAAFAFKDMEYPDAERIRQATAHIRYVPKKDGWGSIAIGTRVGHTPEPDFFVSWTAMITAGNIRQGDTILAPQCYQPAHWAATKMARSFLLSGRDSLLMVDDDMLFPPDALSRMRDNADNWDYDVVMGFATHKVWPPKPVMMKLMPEDKVSIPDRLKGDHHELLHDFENDSVVPVDAVGLAFTLIKRDVFIKMLHPDYGYEYTWFFTYGQGWESDDIPFSRRCRELGFKMAVDTSIKTHHIGRRSLGYEQFMAWKEQQEEPQGVVDFSGDDIIPILRHVADQNGKYSQEADTILGVIRNAAGK